MTAQWILVGYAVLGVVGGGLCVVGSLSEGKGLQVGTVLIVMVFWPLVFLAAAFSMAPAQGGGVKEHRSARAQRVEEVAGRLEECWRQAVEAHTWGTLQARECEWIDRFIARLQKQQRRLDEMEAALAATPASVKERLAELYAHATAEHEHSLGLAENLAARLTVLRFSEPCNLTAERLEHEHLEELLLRIEMLAEAFQPVEGAMAS